MLQDQKVAIRGFPHNACEHDHIWAQSTPEIVRLFLSKFPQGILYLSGQARIFTAQSDFRDVERHLLVILTYL